MRRNFEGTDLPGCGLGGQAPASGGHTSPESFVLDESEVLYVDGGLNPSLLTAA